MRRLLTPLLQGVFVFNKCFTNLYKSSHFNQNLLHLWLKIWKWKNLCMCGCIKQWIHAYNMTLMSVVLKKNQWKLGRFVFIVLNFLHVIILCKPWFVCFCILSLRERNHVYETLAIQWQAIPSGEIDELQWPGGHGWRNPLLGLLSGPLSTPQPHRIHHSICCWYTHTRSPCTGQHKGWMAKKKS